MDSKIKACLVNAAWGAWYPKGSERLERSFQYHGWEHDYLIWRNEAPNGLFNPNFPYQIKASAIYEAVHRGYTHILWMDCSLWVVKNPNLLMEEINTNGGLFIRSGYNLAQTSADSDLEWAKTSRDEAERMHELWSCVFGFNLETEQGKNFYYHFMDGYEHGVFDTPRDHGGRSNDPRFLHARQDQIAASFAYHKSGYNILQDPNKLLCNYNVGDREQLDTIILMRGL